MKEFSIVLILALSIHMILFHLFNDFRISRIKRHINEMNHKNILNERDYNRLVKRYKGFFYYMQGFPDIEEYPKIYEDNKFGKFKIFSRRLMMYFMLSILILLVLSMIFIEI